MKISPLTAIGAKNYFDMSPVAFEASEANSLG
jgi:hypothetical protein